VEKRDSHLRARRKFASRTAEDEGREELDGRSYKNRRGMEGGARQSFKNGESEEQLVMTLPARLEERLSKAGIRSSCGRGLEKSSKGGRRKRSHSRSRAERMIANENKTLRRVQIGGTTHSVST